MESNPFLNKCTQSAPNDPSSYIPKVDPNTLQSESITNSPSATSSTHMSIAGSSHVWPSNWWSTSSSQAMSTVSSASSPITTSSGLGSNAYLVANDINKPALWAILITFILTWLGLVGIMLYICYANNPLTPLRPPTTMRKQDKSFRMTVLSRPHASLRPSSSPLAFPRVTIAKSKNSSDGRRGRRPITTHMISPPVPPRPHNLSHARETFPVPFTAAGTPPRTFPVEPAKIKVARAFKQEKGGG